MRRKGTEASSPNHNRNSPLRLRGLFIVRGGSRLCTLPKGELGRNVSDGLRANRASSIDAIEDAEHRPGRPNRHVPSAPSPSRSVWYKSKREFPLLPLTQSGSEEQQRVPIKFLN